VTGPSGGNFFAIKRFLDRLERPDRELVYWDEDLAGFGLRVKPNGPLSYCV
jgi:hypothetical protein